MANGETIREMIQGFNAMQAQLGLLPPQTGQMPMGVSLNTPPPPPPIVPPSAYGQMAHDQAMAAMQRTMQMAQATRYTPPPSAPTPAGAGLTWGGTMDALAGQQLNPYVANALGGGGMNLPMPMMSPQYGMYRPSGGRMGVPVAPTTFNPYVMGPTSPNFMTPAQQDYARMQNVQARGAAIVSSGLQTGFELGGTLIGGAIGSVAGSVFGPVGSFVGGAVGGYLGEKIGGIGGAMATMPMRDVVRGRQIEALTSPFMVTGSNLNPFTGAGLSTRSAIDTAVQLRGIGRDHDFVRQTGFNTGDIMKLTQLSAEQGLLDMARSPEDIANKVKVVAKSVKALIQITHDPDVRNAIATLGQMRQLGFEGIGAQTSAVANQAMFARMAGVSRSAIDAQYGMPGAMAAQGLGLAGSTGYTAGIAGAGVANVAISAGAFNELQLARAGGRQGVAQTNMMASLGALNQDLYMAAALKRDASGNLTVDTDAFRRAQSQNISSVASQASQRMNEIGAQGISELATRKQEFKDILARSMSPVEQQMAVYRQARAMQRETGLTFGGALSVMVGSTEEGRGMSQTQREQVARTLELQFTSQEFYRGMRRDLGDRNRARYATYRTPSNLTLLGRGIKDVGYNVSDMFAVPFHAATEYLDEQAENRAAFERGERISRYGSTGLVRDERDRQLMREGRGFGGRFRAAMETEGDPGTWSRNFNAIGSAFGLSSLNQANRRFLIAADAQGYGSVHKFFGLYGGSGYDSADKQRQVLDSVGFAADAIMAGQSMAQPQVKTVRDALQQHMKSGRNVDATIREAARTVAATLPTDDGVGDAAAVTKEHLQRGVVSALMNQGGMSREQAEKLFAEKGGDISALVTREMWPHLDQKQRETFMRGQEARGKMAALSGGDPESLKKAIDTVTTNEYNRIGFMKGYDRDVGMVGLGDAQKVAEKLARQDKDVVQIAALREAAARGDKKAEEALTKLAPLGSEKYEQAGRLIAGLDTTEKYGLATLGRGGRAAENVDALRGLVGGTKSVTAQVEAARSLASAVGVEFEGASDDKLKELLSKAATRNLENVSPAMRKAIAAYQKTGSLEEFQAAAEEAGGPAGETTLDSSEQGPEIKRLREDQAMLNEARKDMSKLDKKDQAFVAAVDIFAEAAKNLKDVAEAQQLMLGNPFGGRP